VENYLDLVLFAKDTAAAIVNDDFYTGLADGTYKDTCEGGKGSFEIKVSNNGDLLTQKYNNCELSITENGATEKIIVSGEESVSIIHGGNTPSTGSIVWKNYSISSNGAAATIIDGSFTYEGLLNFEPSFNY